MGVRFHILPIFMKQNFRRFLYILLIVLVVPTFYSIFNVGNPKSLFRFIIKDTSYDMLITIFFGVLMGAIAVILSFQGRRQSSIEHVLDMNKDHILFLRSKGNSDENIANEFLNKMDIKKSGYLSKMALRRVLKYLTKLD